MQQIISVGMQNNNKMRQLDWQNRPQSCHFTQQGQEIGAKRRNSNYAVG
jgi:hypothetical protein